MESTVSSLSFIFIAVLPGFLAYRFALHRRPEVDERSVLWETAFILEYTVYVHVPGVAIVLAIEFILRLSNVETNLSQLPDDGVAKFLAGHPGTGAALLLGYPLYVVIASVFIGSHDVPTKMTSTLLRLMRAGHEFPQAPVWFAAFHYGPEGVNTDYVFIKVRMKNGDIYSGRLLSFPILPDHQNSKDFLLQEAVYFPKGDLSTPEYLTNIDPQGLVLLNSSNVDAIEVAYGREA